VTSSPFPLFAAAAAAAATLLGAAPASAAELRELCIDRPGKDTPPCTVDKGHLVVEVGAFSLSRLSNAEERTTSSGLGETALRLGVTDRSEVQLSFLPYSVVRERDRTTGERRTFRGAGDLVGAYKLNFANPDGQGTSVAAQLFVSAPVGKDGVDSGAWEGGLIVPVSFELPDDWSLTLNPEVDWRADEDGRGHHRAYVGVASLGRELVPGVEGSAEIWASRDQDPSGHRTEASADFALAWQPRQTRNLQFDAEVDLGLTRATADVEVAFGVATRF